MMLSQPLRSSISLVKFASVDFPDRMPSEAIYWPGFHLMEPEFCEPLLIVAHWPLAQICGGGLGLELMVCEKPGPAQTSDAISPASSLHLFIGVSSWLSLSMRASYRRG